VIDVHAYIEVEDVKRAVAFYTDGIGLEILRWLRPHWVELSGASIPIHILARPDQEFIVDEHRLARSYQRHWTPVHLDFVVQDLDSAVARATEAGAALERLVDMDPWWRLANLADPFGNGFDLIEIGSAGYAPIEIPPP
jgi:predicted enzyme related to lactoylglutathione lyase